MEVALLRGLDVERLLLDDERGRDERCARLLDLCRRGLRWRVDVCPVDGSQSGGDEIWSDDVRVDMKVEIQLVGEDGWELVEKLEVVECPMVEGDWWCALGSFLVEVAGEQVAQPLPYPPTGGIRLTVQLDQSPGSHRLVHPLVSVAGEQTTPPLPYPPTGSIRLTVQQDQSPGSHRLAEE